MDTTTSSGNNKIPATNLVSEEHGANDQIRKLGENIERLPLPYDLRDYLLEIIKRLALVRASAGYLSPSYITEYETAAKYLNWITSLPWNSMTRDTLDISMAKSILDKNHYGLEIVKEKILEYIAALILNTRNKSLSSIGHAPILAFVGLAGTGKTTLAASIAESLGRRFERIPFGGLGDARALRGQSRAYGDSEPGYIIKKLVHSQTKNCVILLDELDRVSDTVRADVMGVLLELLDPEQNKAFTDHFIDYPFDLSNVLFVITANNITNISTAVLDRIEIIQMPSYTDEEKIVIAKSYLFPKVRSRTGLLPSQLTIEDALWPTIIRPLGFDSGIRSLERTIDGMCKKVALYIVQGKMQTIAISAQNIREYLPQ